MHLSGYLRIGHGKEPSSAPKGVTFFQKRISTGTVGFDTTPSYHRHVPETIWPVYFQNHVSGALVA
jgi:hypothetical protein